MSLGINFVLLAIILGMFFITYISGNNVNIVNYENELINKYEKWEQVCIYIHTKHSHCYPLFFLSNDH